MATNDLNKIITCNWWTLKLTYGLLFVVAGLDKFFNLITYWEQYVSPHTLNLFHMNGKSFIYLVGIIEIVIGLITLFISTRLGAYLTAAWLFLIVLNLLSMFNYFDIAVRDVVMAIGAIVLAQLTYVKERIDLNKA